MDSSDGFVKAQDAPYVVAERETFGAERVKQGHKFCGGCCDVRRATIIVDIISVCLNVLALFAVIGIHVAQVDHQQINDDQVKQELQDFPFVFSLIWVLVSMILYSCGIFGAIQYNIWLVGIALVLHLTDIVMALIGVNIVGAVIAGTFAYPHIFFIMEVRKGIMSRENYHNEEQSCCCV
jgi:hypothetical protein